VTIALSHTQVSQMEITEFTLPAGSLVPTIAGHRAFLPNNLPPSLDLSPLQQILSDADQKLGELRGVGKWLVNPYLLIRPLQRKEAIASSNIEGTYTSLPELLLFESGVEGQASSTDSKEVYNYTVALREGLSLLDEIPISNRLICALHKRLLSGLPKARAGYFSPGEYRKEQNFIGKSKDISKSRFNPPPPPAHIESMSKLELFINCALPPHIPSLVFLSLIHYQFEAIHPFPDGNGRVGRLLIPIILKNRKIMDEPLLYMSQYFEDNKDEYVDLMLRVSQKSEWIPWVSFFLKGVCLSSEKTIETIQKVRKLQEVYQDRCHQARSSALLLKIIDAVFERGLITIPAVRDITGTSYTSAQKHVAKLIEYDIIRDLDFKSRPKYFFAHELMSIYDS
jgi:Fic family protein